MNAIFKARILIGEEFKTTEFALAGIFIFLKISKHHTESFIYYLSGKLAMMPLVPWPSNISENTSAEYESK